MICPNAHQTNASDYCDICGAPLNQATRPAGDGPERPVCEPASKPQQAQLALQSGAPAPQQALDPGAGKQQCPNCGVFSDVGVMFCEVCGYDFVTGALPRASQPVHSGAVPSSQAGGGVAGSSEAVGDVSQSSDAPVSPLPPIDLSAAAIAQAPEAVSFDLPAPTSVAPGYPSSQPNMPQASAPVAAGRFPPGRQPGTHPGVSLQPGPSSTEESSHLVPAAPRPARIGNTKWVAEVWVDPQWFALQQSPDHLPSPGLPQVIGLHTQRVLIGRPSSQTPEPGIDCVADSGVSRRQAMLLSDGIRWFVEDLGSSNGTFIGQVDEPLPTRPITGRVEVGPHTRIYIGSWTRIVVRPTLIQESYL